MNNTRPPENGAQSVEGTAKATLPRHITLQIGFVVFCQVLFQSVKFALPFFVIVSFALSLLSTNVLISLPGWLHVIILGAIAFGLCTSLWHAYKALALNGIRVKAIDFLEHQNNSGDHPIRLIEDRQAEGQNSKPSATTTAFWRHEQAQALLKLNHFKTPIYWPGFARFDPLGLRVMAPMILAIMVIIHHQNFVPRIIDNLTPNFQTHRLAADTPTLLAFVTPPDYLNHARITLPSYDSTSPIEETAPIIVVTGSQLSINEPNHHLDQFLTLERNGQLIDLTTDTDQSEHQSRTDTSHQNDLFKLTLNLPGRFQLSHSEGHGTIWPFTVIEDQSPQIKFKDNPSLSTANHLLVPFSARDDFGIKSIALHVIPAWGQFPTKEQTESLRENIKAEDIFDLKDAPYFEIPFVLHDDPKAKDDRFYTDFLRHPWAGQTVSLRISVVDIAGQIGTSKIITLKLPKQDFENAVAGRIAAVRTRLIHKPTDLTDNMLELRRLIKKPERYDDSIPVHLALSHSSHALAYMMAKKSPFEANRKSLSTITDLLWTSALAVELGESGLLASRMEQLQNDLRRALQDQNGGDTASDLVDAMENMLVDMLRKLADQQKNAPPSNYMGQPEGEVIDARDLKSMMDHLRNLLQNGATEEALAMLGEIQSIMQGINELAQQPDTNATKAGDEIMRDLEKIQKDQMQIRDQTFSTRQEEKGRKRWSSTRDSSTNGDSNQSQSSRWQPSPEEQKAYDQQAQQQKDMQEEMDKLIGRMDRITGGTPKSLEDAQAHMKNAQTALENGQGEDALGHQGAAVEALGRAQQESQQHFIEYYANQGLLPMMRGQSAGQNQNQDPLSRTPGQAHGTSTVKIPDQAPLKRSRTIRNQIRDRANDPTRPAVEQDYHRRLLDRF